MRIQDAAAYNLQWTSNEEGKTFLDLDSSAFVHQFVSDFGLSTAVECLVLNHFSASLCFVVFISCGEIAVQYSSPYSRDL